MLGISRVVLLTGTSDGSSAQVRVPLVANQFDFFPGPPPVGLCARMRAVHGCVELWDSMITPFLS